MEVEVTHVMDVKCCFNFDYLRYLPMAKKKHKNKNISK